ncbi:MAG: hypothetical protein ACRDVN_10565 [Jiangellaceae bacterium]
MAALDHPAVAIKISDVRRAHPQPWAPVFGNTMGAQRVVDYVDATADLDDLGSLRVSGTGAYVQDGERPRPDDVFAKPAATFRQQPWGPHVTTDGNQVSAVNVLILEVASETRKIGDGSGAPVPVLELVDAAGGFVALTELSAPSADVMVR